MVAVAITLLEDSGRGSFQTWTALAMLRWKAQSGSREGDNFL